MKIAYCSKYKGGIYFCVDTNTMINVYIQIEDIALSFNFSIVLSDIVKDRWTDRHGSTLKLDLKVAAFIFSARVCYIYSAHILMAGTMRLMAYW